MKYYFTSSKEVLICIIQFCYNDTATTASRHQKPYLGHRQYRQTLRFQQYPSCKSDYQCEKKTNITTVYMQCEKWLLFYDITSEKQKLICIRDCCVLFSLFLVTRLLKDSLKGRLRP